MKTYADRVPEKTKQSINRRLDFLYEEKAGPGFRKKFLNLIGWYLHEKEADTQRWDQNDILLITYGDSVKNNEEPAIRVLHRFLNQYLSDELTFVHLLPFYPYSSDDGFSVIDYTEVNKELGNWDDVSRMEKDFKLMFDLVLNHISRKSEWFTNYLQDVHPGKDFFIEVHPGDDLSHVVRPRNAPLLTPFEKLDGIHYIWTTFSEDQIDLDYSNPEVLYEMMRVLLFYLDHGARIIRLDAIAYLWKKKGTTCLHLPETHVVVKLIREIMEAYDPKSILLTETNVPNRDNLTYFGDGDETNMIYQFSLPPLLLHALYSGNATYLTQWGTNVPDVPGGCTYFNFTASHDGIGVRPLEGLLPEDDLNNLVEDTRRNGGKVSMRRNSDGSESPYELNITYFDALRRTQDGEDDRQIDRFIASQTIMLEMRGMPAFYIHSLLATKNYYKGVEQTGRARTINRRKWNEHEIKELLSRDNVHSEVLNKLKRIIKTRKIQKAFHPDGKQEVFDIGKQLFALRRTSPDKKQQIVCITNVSSKTATVDKRKIDGPVPDFDLFTKLSPAAATDTFDLEPYQTVWLTEGSYFKRDD